MGRYTRGCEFHRYICGMGQDSGRSSSVTSYWFWAFGWISALVVAAMCDLSAKGETDYTVGSSAMARFQIRVTAARSVTNSVAGTRGASFMSDRWCVRAR